MHPILTIGHSNHAFGKFLELLKGAGIAALADVRSVPVSRYVPHFNRKALAPALKEHGIAYVYLGRELGGRPAPEHTKNGRADYAAMAQAPEFAEGIARVVRGAQTQRIALMCAERDPVNCHRFHLVARALEKLQPAPEIAHILADGTVEPHAATMQRHARASANLFSREE